MTMSNHQTKAAKISLIVSFCVLALKFIAYFYTNSTAILSDALETITNVVTAIVGLIVLRYALEPADENHPYGHGKLEYFSAAFEGGIILFAAFAIIFESIRTMIDGYDVKNITVGIGYILAASVVNLVVGLYLIRVGKKQNSETLKAGGMHLLADVKTTAGVILGLVLYKVTGWQWVDPVIGILVGLWLGHESSQIIKRNIGGLLDETDLESVADLAKNISTHIKPGIIDIHNLRIIRSGSFHHIDAHIVVPEFWNIKIIHDLAHDFEKSVVNDYKFEGEFAFHTDPCHQHYCKNCDIANCPVRKSEFKAPRDLSAQHMIKGPQYTD